MLEVLVKLFRIAAYIAIVMALTLVVKHAIENPLLTQTQLFLKVYKFLLLGITLIIISGVVESEIE